MKQNYKVSPLSVAFILVLMVAMMAGIFLTGKVQETRKGAYFSGAKLLILPTDITAKVGDVVPVQLWVQTENDAKVSAVDTKICYGTGLALEATDVTTLIELNSEAFKVIEYVKNEANCLRLVAVSSGIAPENLKSGLVKVANVRFKAVNNVSGKLEMSVTTSKVSGYNPVAGATDTSMKIGSVENANYVITKDVIVIPTETLMPTLTPQPTQTLVPTQALVPTETPVAMVEPYLKFRMSFLGERSIDVACADIEKMPLTITVMANDGESRVYENVLAKSMTASDTTDLQVYEFGLKLTGFNYTDEIAVFLKGPKHLQVKYGVDGQNDYYGIDGGELMGLTEDENTTPMFSFEGFPLLAGDVTGPDSVQDGVVDGLDFSYVKSESIKRTEVEPHDYMLADLNGNCKMESQDLSNLMLSLSVRQSQLY
jgi:hypothetical protein